MFLANTLLAEKKKKEEEEKKEENEKEKREEEPTTSAAAAAEPGISGTSQGDTGLKENAELAPDSDPGILLKMIEETEPPTFR